MDGPQGTREKAKESSQYGEINGKEKALSGRTEGREQGLVMRRRYAQDLLIKVSMIDFQ